MSNFTLAISILGGLILAAVVAHTAWQSRMTSKKNDRLNDGRKEPGIHSLEGYSGAAEDRLPVSIFSQSQFGGAAHNSTLGSTFGSAAALSDALTDTLSNGSDGSGSDGIRSKSLLDPLIDLVVSLPLDDDLLTTHDMPQVPGEQAVAVLNKLPSRQRIGSKPFVVEGLNLRTENWELPRLDERYGMFQAGVQLANRKGALTEIEFSEFVVQVQQFADAVGATCVLPDMQEQLERARELDTFASAHDAQLQLTLVPAVSNLLDSEEVLDTQQSSSAWTVAQVQTAARGCGLVAGLIAGRMVFPAPAAQASPSLAAAKTQANGKLQQKLQHYAAPWLTLSYDFQAALDGMDDVSHSNASHSAASSALQALSAPHANLYRVHLSLDVPHVTDPPAAFAALCETAQSLCDQLQARLVDDDGVAIHPDALQQIGSELEYLCTALAERDLAAGSVQARRLFS